MGFLRDRKIYDTYHKHQITWDKTMTELIQMFNLYKVRRLGTVGLDKVINHNRNALQSLLPWDVKAKSEMGT